MPIAELAAASDVVIDFTHASTAQATRRASWRTRGTAWVLGTTGLSAADEASVAARRRPHRRSSMPPISDPASTSCWRSPASSAPPCPPSTTTPRSWRCTIARRSTRRPAPRSRSAARSRPAAACGSRSVTQSGRDGHTGPRPPGAIGFAALRGGQVVGEHTLLFAAAGEHIALTHRAFDRRRFAAGRDPRRRLGRTAAARPLRHGRRHAASLLDRSGPLGHTAPAWHKAGTAAARHPIFPRQEEKSMRDKGEYLFTSESVSEGHPDKVADRISDTVLDTFLAADPQARVGCETLVTTNRVVLAGEARGPASVTHDLLVERAREAIRDIGYDQAGFSWKNAEIDCLLHAQCADIAVGVDSAGNKDEGAGDQGIMFGYACTETPALMPAPLHYAHQILRRISEGRVAGRRRGRRACCRTPRARSR